MQHTLETDYLIIGAGAMGMAFADELIHNSRDLQVIIVDRRSRAGGHWVDAYPFVRLHQPAAYYGVNSEPLGKGGADLSSKAEILAYYERVVDKLTATGRVRFFWQSEATPEGELRSLVVPDLHHTVTVRRKLVNATYSQMQVPSTHPPRYTVADEAHLVPINGLATLDKPWSSYVVIGAGKTGIDAVLYLLAQGVQPEHIQWIVSKDPWFFDRSFAEPWNAIPALPRLAKLTMGVTNPEDLFRAVEALGTFTRLDEARWPTKFRCATVNRAELEALRGIDQIGNVVRMGRVQAIRPDTITLDEGTLPTGQDVLHIDCTANGLVNRPPVPIFEPKRITLQPMAMCQQVFSAALTAAIELRYEGIAHKNSLCTPVPHPEYPVDFFGRHLQTVENMRGWLLPFGGWLLNKRLSVINHVSRWRLFWALLRGWRWWLPSLDRFRTLTTMAQQAANPDTPDPSAP